MVQGQEKIAMTGPIKNDEDQNKIFIKIICPGSENRSADRYLNEINNKEENMDLILPFSKRTVSFSPLTYEMVTSKSPTISSVEKYSKQACEESKVEEKRVVPFKKSSSLQEWTKGMKDEKRVNKGLDNCKIKKRGKVFSVAVRKVGIKGYQYLRKQKVQRKHSFDEKRVNKGLDNCKIKKRGKVFSVAVRKIAIKGYQYLRKQKVQRKHSFDLIGIFQHVRLRSLCSTILQLILFMVCFCGAYGKSTEKEQCQLKFGAQLYSDKLLLKCFYNEHCKGTLKWTGGKSGTTLFNVDTSPTEKVRFIDGKEEKWFGMQIKNWNQEDIEAQYKCWFGFSALIVNIVNRAVLNKPFDDDMVKYKCTNGENNVILNAKVLHTNRQSSFTAFIQDQDVTKQITSIESPKKNGPLFETRINLNLKLTKEDNNKTFMLLFRGEIIIKEVINTTLCRGNEDSSNMICVDPVCQGILLCIGGLGCLAFAAFIGTLYKKHLLCFKIDNTEDEVEHMSNTYTDETVSRNTQDFVLIDSS